MPKSGSHRFAGLVKAASGSRITLLVIVVVFGGLGTYLLTASHAATPAANLEAENGTVSSAAGTVNDPSASGGKAVKFGNGGIAGCTPQAGIPAGFPNNCTTGYAAAPDYPGILTTYSSTANGTNCSGPITSGKTYNFCNFPGGLAVGSSSTAVSNVTFHGCWFHDTASGGALVILYGDNLTFDYSSFTPDVSGPPVSYDDSYEYGLEADGGYYSHVERLTVTYSDFWGFADAIDTDGSTQTKPQVFRGNWLHDSAADGGVAHTDGIGTLSGSGTSSYVVIDNNTIESSANTNAIAYQGGTYSNFTITNNLLGGFGYTVALVGTVSNVAFTGNTFSTQFPMGWGPLYPNAIWSSASLTWHDNKWYVPSGAAWGDPTHSGWYWLPVDTENGGSSDTPYVSQTDYSG